MRIAVSIYYIALISLFISAPLLAAGSIAQVQSFFGQVWIQRGDKQIEVNTESEINFGDLISTLDTGQLDLQLWSQLKLTLDANSKIMIMPAANKKEQDAAAEKKIIKLDRGKSCIEIDHELDSAVLFQMGARVTAKFIKPVELCMSTDADKSNIQLIKGSVGLIQLSSSMLIGLSQPGSEISFFDDGTYQLDSAANVTKPAASVIEQVDLPEKQKDLFTVYLYSSRFYDSTAEVSKRFRDVGEHSIIIGDADDQGPLYRVAVTDFESLSAARAFIENVAVKLGVKDAWIAGKLKEK
jgi:hypothetical protein